MLLDFSGGQQYAATIKLTPEIKQALVTASRNGQRVSLRFTDSGEAVLSIGEQQHVFVAAAEDKTDIIALPSPGSSNAPASAIAVVGSKLNPQKTLSASLASKMRASSQEAARKSKERSAVMLDGRVGQRPVKATVTVTKKVIKQTTPPPSTFAPQGGSLGGGGVPKLPSRLSAPTPTHTPQPPSATMAPRPQSAGGAPGSMGASTGGLVGAQVYSTSPNTAPGSAAASPAPPPPPQHLPPPQATAARKYAEPPKPGAAANKPRTSITPPSSRAGTPPLSTGDEGGGGSAPPAHLPTGSVVAPEIPAIAVAAAKEREGLPLVLLALLRDGRGMSGPGLQRAVEAVYRQAGAKQEAREYVKRVIDASTERVPPNKLVLRRSYVERDTPKLAALEQSLGGVKAGGPSGGSSPDGGSSGSHGGGARARPGTAAGARGVARTTKLGARDMSDAGGGGKKRRMEGEERVLGISAAGTESRDGSTKDRDQGRPVPAAAADKGDTPTKKKRKLVSVNEGAGGNPVAAPPPPPLSAMGAGGAPGASRPPGKPSPSVGKAGVAVKRPGGSSGSLALVRQESGSMRGAALPAAPPAPPLAPSPETADEGVEVEEIGEDGGEEGAGTAGAPRTRPSTKQQSIKGIADWEEDERDVQGWVGLSGLTSYGSGPELGWGADLATPFAPHRQPAALSGEAGGYGEDGEAEGENGEGEIDDGEQLGQDMALWWGSAEPPPASPALPAPAPAPSPPAAADVDLDLDIDEHTFEGTEGGQGNAASHWQWGPAPVPPPPPLAATLTRAPSSGPPPMPPAPPPAAPVPPLPKPPTPAPPPPPPSTTPTPPAASQPSKRPPPRPQPSSQHTPPPPGAPLAPKPVKKPRSKTQGDRAGDKARPADPDPAAGHTGGVSPQVGSIGAVVPPPPPPQPRSGRAPSTQRPTGQRLGRQQSVEGPLSGPAPPPPFDDDAVWDQVEIEEDSGEDLALYAEFIGWEPPATHPPINTPAELDAVQQEFKRKYNVYFKLHQRYNNAVIEMEGLAGSQGEAERGGDLAGATRYSRALWLAGARKMVLMCTWRKVRDALATDLERMRDAAEAYVARARRHAANQGGAGRTVAVA